MIKTYKILSLLLSYPDAALQEFLPAAVRELQNEALLQASVTESISLFANHYGNAELTDWQAEYVQLFDCTRSASLNLFEHVKGDSKDRGQAMVDLIDLYQAAGMQFSSTELPDYLPAFLEFLSSLDSEKAADLLSEPAPVIRRIFLTLKEKDHPYQHIMSAIVSLAARQPAAVTTETTVQNEIQPDPDSGYEEKPVSFGGSDPCANCKM